MPRPKKNPITDPTGEKAAEKAKTREEENSQMSERIKARFASMGIRATEAATAAGTTFEPVVNAAQTVSNAVSNVAQSVGNAASNVTQSVAGSSIQRHSDPRGGLKVPEMDFTGLIPSDLLHPSGLPKVSEEELTAGLAEYAGATRAQRLYQAGFKYIEEVGKTKQQYHKAEQSIIKAATESVKVQQEVVRFDKQNVELDIDLEKLEHSKEKLKQARITTIALQHETSQIGQKFEAQRHKRDAEIKSIQAQSQDIIQKYLKDSVNA